jgi:hypothetical protein
MKYKPLDRNAGFEIKSYDPQLGHRTFICVKLPEHELMDKEKSLKAGSNGFVASAKELEARRSVHWLTFDQSDVSPMKIQDINECKKRFGAYRDDIASVLSEATSSDVSPENLMSACAFSTVELSTELTEGGREKRKKAKL